MMNVMMTYIRSRKVRGVRKGTSTEDEGLDRVNPIQGNISTNQLTSQQYLHTSQAPAESSVVQSVSSKNALKREHKSSTTSSKLRSTTSKLFDKKDHNQEGIAPSPMILI